MKKHILIFTVISAFASFLFAGCVCFHSPISKGNFNDLDIQFENVELSNPYKSKLVKTTISGWMLHSALSISSYKIRYENDKIFIDIDRKIGSTGMGMDYYIQFLMRPSVKDIFIGNSLFWTRSAESFFKSKNMKFPLNIVVKNDYSDGVAWGKEICLSEQECADIKKFAEHVSKTLTFEKCKTWNKNAVAFELCDFGIFAEYDGRKFFCMSVDAYFDGAEVFDMRRRVGKHDVSALHNILLFDYDTFEEIGWVY